MDTDLITLIVQGAPNLVGMLIAIGILYRIVTQNQEDILDRMNYLDHQMSDLRVQLISIIERMNREKVE